MCTIATTYYWLTFFARMRQGRIIEKLVGKMSVVYEAVSWTKLVCRKDLHFTMKESWHLSGN